jgi:transcriptional regulator with XRE-family HTH domain
MSILNDNITNYGIEVIGNRINSARCDADLTQEKLGEKIGKGRETISAWEHGKSWPGFQDMLMICNVCDCDLGYLIGEYEEKHRITSDICAETGLSETAADFLRSLKKFGCSDDNNYIYALDVLFADYQNVLLFLYGLQHTVDQKINYLLHRDSDADAALKTAAEAINNRDTSIALYGLQKNLNDIIDKFACCAVKYKKNARK